jgi:hypothetical protein
MLGTLSWLHFEATQRRPEANHPSDPVARVISKQPLQLPLNRLAAAELNLSLFLEDNFLPPHSVNGTVDFPQPNLSTTQSGSLPADGLKGINARDSLLGALL